MCSVSLLSLSVSQLAFAIHSTHCDCERRRNKQELKSEIMKAYIIYVHFLLKPSGGKSLITIKSSWELLASLIFLYILLLLYNIYIFLCLEIELEVAIKSKEIHVCIIAVS